MTITIKDIDTSTGEEEIREATPEEIAALEIANAETESMREAANAQAATKAAVLARLGITEDELRAALA